MKHLPRWFAPIGALVAVTIVAACADGELPPRSAIDPANPNAPESPYTPPKKNAATNVSSTSDATPSAQPGMVYACPMGHGTWPAPGTCPVCGMTLVPKPAPSASGSASAMPDMPGMKMP